MVLTVSLKGIRSRVGITSLRGCISYAVVHHDIPFVIEKATVHAAGSLGIQRLSITQLVPGCGTPLGSSQYTPYHSVLAKNRAPVTVRCKCALRT